MIDAQQQQVVDTTEVSTQETETKVITVSGVLADLDNGMDRKAIANKYGLTIEEVRAMFQHPTLKGKRPKRALKKITFTLVDDTTSEDESELTTSTVEDNVGENANEDTYNDFQILD
jgi:predicted xylose isomerase-like sugar epimerase